MKGRAKRSWEVANTGFWILCRTGKGGYSRDTKGSSKGKGGYYYKDERDYKESGKGGSSKSSYYYYRDTKGSSKGKGGYYLRTW